MSSSPTPEPSPDGAPPLPPPPGLAHAPIAPAPVVDVPPPVPPGTDATSVTVPPAATPVRRGFSILRVAFFFYGVVTLFAFGYAISAGHLGRLFGESAPRLQHLLAAVGLGCIIVAACHLGVRAWKPFARASEAGARLLGALNGREVLVLALLSGFAEELLFRGALWPALGLAGTTVLFAIVHIIPTRALWVYPLFAGVAGLLLGLLRDGTESVVPCMVAHAVVNGLNLAWLSRVARGGGTT
jgi:membrane protease YdiL (CAAX protease family)